MLQLERGPCQEVWNLPPSIEANVPHDSIATTCRLECSTWRTIAPGQRNSVTAIQPKSP
jgi:hypothetical protein